MLVDPANQLLSVLDNSQLPVSEEESSVITQNVEFVGDPLHSSSFVEVTSLHSSLTEDSLSQSLSLTEEMSRSIGEQPEHTTESLVQPTELSDLTVPPFTCGCTRILKGKPCSTLFSPQYYQKMRDNCAELLKSELDNIVKGQIMAFTSMDDMTKIRSRQKVRGTYYHQGHKICW